MRLPTRLFLIVLVCLVPVIGAQIYNQVQLAQQREDQLAAVALRQAELANNDLGSIIEGARQLGGVISAVRDVQGQSASCSEQLGMMLPRLSGTLFLAVVDGIGRVTCASPARLNGMPPGSIVSSPELGHDFGEYSTVAGVDGAFLPVYTPIQGGGAVVLALDLRWLSRHLQQLTLGSAPPLSGGMLILADRKGTVLARVPDPNVTAGQKLPPELQAVITGSRTGVRVVTDQQGRRQLAAVTQYGDPPEALTTIQLLPLPDSAGRADEAVHLDLLLAAGAATLALMLAWIAGRRFVSGPVMNLTAAADALARGDLQARADAGHGEFAGLARAFNAMAESLEGRERTRGLEAELLTAQLAQRSRELSENNNRLQVEIAEREKTEAALTHTQKLQAVGQLAGGLAHDFNNMLATVLGSLELMERRVGQNPRNWTDADIERVRTLIERSTSAVQRGGQLTSGLLAFSRRPRAAARPTDINKLISDLSTLATTALGRRIPLSTELEETPWPALADPSQVEAAILNLCLNARDAMPDGGSLTIRTSNVTIASSTLADEPAPGAYVCILVADTGAGMPPEVQRRAFDPFFTTKSSAGSGLGLSQVAHMVRQAGGSVRLRSTPGRGTEVTLLLPRAASEAAPDTAPRSPAGATRRNGPAVTVLVVDDDNAVRQVTVEMLRDLGCAVIQASGGGEALALLEGLGSTPDIVLLDYAMPGMNGLTLARRLREEGLAAPIALVTGYAELNEAEGGAVPLDGLLRKPFTIEELQSLLIGLGGKSRMASNVVRLNVPHRR